MKSLPLPDRRHLEAAEGWLGLGNWREAIIELDQISPEWRANPAVLEMRYRIFSRAGRWNDAVEIARSVARSFPDDPWGFFHLAYSLHELKLTREAYNTLKPVMDKFPAEWLMRFNLACYACRLGNLNEAMLWLKKAIDLAGKKAIQKVALDDQDLEPLWARIREI